MNALPIGKAELRRQGRRVALLAFGTMLTPALEAGEDLDATVVNMRFVKPLDEELISRLAQSHDLLVTIEENTIQGGAGSAVGEFLAAANITVGLLQLGLPDKHLEHGKPAQMLAECGLDAEGIKRAVLQAKPVPLAGILESA